MKHKPFFIIIFVIFISISGATTAAASNISTHTAVAYLIGDCCRDGGISFTISLTSHVIADKWDYEYYFDWRTPSGLLQNSDYILFDLACTGLVIHKICMTPDPKKRTVLLSSFGGSLLFDGIEAAAWLMGRRKPIFPWHYNDGKTRIKSKYESMLVSAIFTVIALNM